MTQQSHYWAYTLRKPRDTCALVLIAALFTIARIWKQPRCPFTGGWIQKLLYIYTVEVRIRFKGLDLIECLMNYRMRFVTLYRRQGSRPSQWKGNAKKKNGYLGTPYK